MTAQKGKSENRVWIKNGKIIDGTGGPAHWADLLIKGSHIEAIIPKKPRCPNKESSIVFELNQDGDRVIDISGRVVTPGFIDGHRHGDRAALLDPEYGIAELAQGITTVINGQCGMSLSPTSDISRRDWYAVLEPCLGPIPDSIRFDSFDGYQSALAEVPRRINCGAFIGMGSVRTAVKGFSRSAYNETTINQAKNHVERAMNAGALGASAGIMYIPECYTTPAEYAQLLQPVANHDALFSCHIRGEGDSLVSSVEEAIEIAGRANVRLNISHFKSVGPRNWKQAIHQAIERIERADEDVSVDFYPYLGGATTLLTLLPPSVMKESLDETLDDLSRPDGAARLRAALNQDHPGWDNLAKSLGWSRVVISSVQKRKNTPYAGQNVAQIADQLGKDPVDFVCDLLVSEEGKVGIILMSMCEEDLDTIARLPYSMVISDALYSSTDHPHPRLYGTFPRFIRKWTRERPIMNLEEAVHKMTGLPADRYRLGHRGQIQEGWNADMNIFYPENIHDRADYIQSKQLSEGMDLVFVNGSIAWQQNKAFPRRGSENFSGQIIRASHTC